MTLEYTLTFAGIPFVVDEAFVVRAHQEYAEKSPPAELLPLRKHQPESRLIDEIDRLMPFCYLQDFVLPPSFPGRNLSALARIDRMERFPSPEVKIGDWYYPTNAQRWSVFRGLATSSQAKAMLESTNGKIARPFVMQANPISFTNPNNVVTDYTVTTNMHMLPPRCLGEMSRSLDGLYLITLVDERYYWQYNPVSLAPITKDTTWANLISLLATALGISITYSALAAAYSSPEPDSQLWTRHENAAFLLDSVAYNVGRVVVRNLNGTYSLLTPNESKTITEANRGPIPSLARTAGGDIFNPLKDDLPIGDLSPSVNPVLPATYRHTFPKYVVGDDPVPHYLNSRYTNQRPTAWYEDSHGDSHAIDVTVASLGLSTITGVPVVGTSGQIQTIRNTAKALLSGDIATTPINQSGLLALAKEITNDCVLWQVAYGLDETWPGTKTLTMEGLHDVIWSYSSRRRQATTRIMRTEWNRFVPDFQHAAPPLSGSTKVTPGVGGPSVAQTWRDSFSGSISTQLNATLSSGSMTATLLGINHLPTQNRWKGRVEDETILFEGTSGGDTVGIVYRGYDGTIEADHANTTTVTMLLPNTTYGVNLVTWEKGQFVFPQEHNSGGIQGVRVVPQTQTVMCLSNSGTLVSGSLLYSGMVQMYGVAGGTSLFTNRELCWIAERNNNTVTSGRRYDGTLASFSASGLSGGVVAPIYLFNEDVASGGGGGGSATIFNAGYISGILPVSGIKIINFQSGVFLVSGIVDLLAEVRLQSGAITSGYIGNTAVVSGSIASGQVSSPHLASGAVQSGHIGNNAVTSGNYSSGSVSDNVLSSGAVRSGHVAQAAVLSGTLASGATGNNLLDNFFHFDTASGAASIGRLIVGNSGNRWAYFSGGTAAISGHLLAVNPDNNQGLNYIAPAAAATHQLLVPPPLGAHTDTQSGAPLKGSLIVGLSGNALWARFPIVSGIFKLLAVASNTIYGVDWKELIAVNAQDGTRLETSGDSTISDNTDTRVLFASPGGSGYTYDVNNHYLVQSGTFDPLDQVQVVRHVGCNIRWAGSESGHRRVRIVQARSGGIGFRNIIAEERFQAVSGGPWISLSSQFLAQGSDDVAFVEVYQNAGTGVDVLSGSNFWANAWIHQASFSLG